MRDSPLPIVGRYLLVWPLPVIPSNHESIVGSQLRLHRAPMGLLQSETPQMAHLNQFPLTRRLLFDRGFERTARIEVANSSATQGSAQRIKRSHIVRGEHHVILEEISDRCVEGIESELLGAQKIFA